MERISVQAPGAVKMQNVQNEDGILRYLPHSRRLASYECENRAATSSAHPVAIWVYPGDQTTTSPGCIWPARSATWKLPKHMQGTRRDDMAATMRVDKPLLGPHMSWKQGQVGKHVIWDC